MAKSPKIVMAGRPDRRPNPGKQFRYVKTGWPERAELRKALDEMAKAIGKEMGEAFIAAFTLGPPETPISHTDYCERLAELSKVL